MWNTFENTIRAQVAPVVNLRLRPYCAREPAEGFVKKGGASQNDLYKLYKTIQSLQNNQSKTPVSKLAKMHDRMIAMATCPVRAPWALEGGRRCSDKLDDQNRSETEPQPGRKHIGHSV